MAQPGTQTRKARCRARLQQCGQGLVGQHLEGLRVAEEVGHADQQFAEEHVDLVGILLQIADVFLRLLDLMDVHPPFDPPADRALLVAAEIVPGAGAAAPPIQACNDLRRYSSEPLHNLVIRPRPNPHKFFFTVCGFFKLSAALALPKWSL